ncbi:guanylate kinase [Rhodospirillales bacterium]|jgi:guanylate kinase|nr:guanylate kinase [Rhodospirillales bacterium]MDC1213651.1 guanylate kinase [Rhodospirillales bacterium]
MLVLSSPSGAGKSTISRALLEKHPDLTMSVSATTRPMRPGEVEGKDYYFIDNAKFEDMVADGDFLEHAQVFDNYYGTPRPPVVKALEQGKDVLFDVDWQGTQQLRQNARDDLVSIFILPPSVEELERRLYTRGQDPEDVVKKRMAKATSEMSHWAEYDYIIINEAIEHSVRETEAILSAERLKLMRRVGMSEWLRGMGVGQ